MQDLILSLKSANSERSKKRSEIIKIVYDQKLFKFLESRFENGGIYVVKNYHTDYKLTVKDQDGNDKTVCGLIADNGKTYLGFIDIAFPKKLYKREIRKVDGEETTTYTQLDKKIYQGDLAILFDKFKSQYKDSLIAFDLLYSAIAKHNESTFVSESFIYPSETFQRFKGEYVTSNFYLFNLKSGGTSDDEIAEIVADICADYDNSLNEKLAEAPVIDMNIKISWEEVLKSDIYNKNIPLIDMSILEAKKVVKIKPQKKRSGQHYGREWVDLGLPSGVKWATCNVGASSPEEYGNYYAWSETNTSSEYVEGNCSTYSKSMGDISGDAQYDVARKYWGGSWRMPTKTEMQELEKNCSWTWTTLNDIKGCKVTGPNGNSIFLPATGSRHRSSLYGAGGRYVSKPTLRYMFCKLHTGRGDYWSSSPSDDKCDFFKNASAYCLFCSSVNHDTSTEFRYVGKCIRPVFE